MLRHEKQNGAARMPAYLQGISAYQKVLTRQYHAYHQAGTGRYCDMRRAWMSGCSPSERCRCKLMGLRKYKTAWTIVAVMDAKARPYEIAKVAERKRGLYDL